VILDGSTTHPCWSTAWATADSFPGIDPNAQASIAAQAVNPKPAQNFWTTVDDLINGFFDHLPMFGLALAIFVLFWLLAVGLRRVIRKPHAEDKSARDLRNTMGSLVHILLIIAGILLAVTTAAPSVNPSDLLGAMGFMGVAVGFAFRDILQNLLAGILILLREPFSVEDQIRYKDFEGTVVRIETRATIIMTYDGRRVVIPNGEIYTNAVVVNTAMEKRRSQYDVGIGYGDSIVEAKRVMIEAMQATDGVLADPAPEVLTIDLASSSVNLRARWWSAPEQGEVIHTQDKVLTAMKMALDKAGIDMPYPTQVHRLHDQTEATDGDRTRQREGWTPRRDDPVSARLSMVLPDSSAGEDYRGAQDNRADMGKDQNQDYV